jgi:hypothetical protein
MLMDFWARSFDKLIQFSYPFSIGIYRNLQVVLGPNPLLWWLPQRMSGDGLRYPTLATIGKGASLFISTGIFEMRVLEADIRSIWSLTRSVGAVLMAPTRPVHPSSASVAEETVREGSVYVWRGATESGSYSEWVDARSVSSARGSTTDGFALPCRLRCGEWWVGRVRLRSTGQRTCGRFLGLWWGTVEHSCCPSKSGLGRS